MARKVLENWVVSDNNLFLKIFILLYVFIPHAFLVPTEKGIMSLGIGVTDDCEPPCGCWDLNLGPLPE